jgi:hypothetical protein
MLYCQVANLKMSTMLRKSTTGDGGVDICSLGRLCALLEARIYVRRLFSTLSEGIHGYSALVLGIKRFPTPGVLRKEVLISGFRDVQYFQNVLLTWLKIR